jgi:hypothetical protein
MDEEKHHWFYMAFGWTIAAALFTGWAFWLGDAHSRSFSGLGWLLALYWWCVALWERHKSNRATRR